MSRLRLALIGLLAVALVVSITFIACRWELHSSIEISKTTRWGEHGIESVFETKTIRTDWHPSIQPYPMESLFGD